MAGVAKVDNQKAFTTFRLVPAINQKNYYTGYLKKESQYLTSKPRSRTPEETRGTNVVVVHLGSRNLRIGRASDAYPVTVPFVVARKPSHESDLPETNTEGFEEALEQVQQDFKERMKFYRTRIISNAQETCRSFNSRQHGEKDGDDYMDDVDDGAVAQEDLLRSYYGKDALKMAEKYPELSLFWPLRRGVFNDALYQSPEELLSDVSGLLAYSANELLKIPSKEFGNHDTILVIPDLYFKSVTESVLRVLFTDLGFANVSIIQESVAATFGAGISCACIVDVGAQTTTVSCVEEGYCIPDSRVHLDFGGDEISAVFHRLLERIEFPHSRELDLVRSYTDLMLIDSLKQKYGTTNESDIAVQLYSFKHQGLKYSFKVYNEVMLPVLGLFYPDIFPVSRSPSPRFLGRAHDPYDGRLSDPISDADINVRLGTLALYGQSYHDRVDTSDGAMSGVMDLTPAEPKSDSVVPEQSREGTPSTSDKPVTGPGGGGDKEKPVVRARAQLDVFESLDLDAPVSAPLDHAITESIAMALQNATTSLTTTPNAFYENLMVIGGGAKFPGFHQLLTDRLGMWASKQIRESGDIAVMAVPREMDPEIIVWKGASVYSKLKVCDEMWVSKHEWEMLGVRAVNSRVLFMY